MKLFIARLCTASLLIAGVASVDAQSTGQAEKLLESARHKEVMEGDLKAAIDQYRKIAAQFAKQPDIAARALFQLGQCQEKLGQADARKSYERIVREYGGSQQYASAARARLAALGGGQSVGQATRLVLTGPKVDTYESSFSPDGRFITWPNWDTGNLTLRDLATGADRPLTNTGTFKRSESAFAEGSAISRDGKQVAYAWYDEKLDRYELWVLNLNGDPNPRRVFGSKEINYLEPKDWSPDGKWIAADLYGKNHTQRITHIGLIAVQDGSLHVLKSGTDWYVRGFSSDGKYILHTRKAGGVDQAYTMLANGESEVRLIPGSASSAFPIWAPDGSRVVFVSDRSGAKSLWSVRVADGKAMGEPELLKADFDNRLIAFARDGSLIYSVFLNLTDIYVAGLDPANGKLTTEPRRVNERAIGNSWGPIAWLPDSKSLSLWNKLPTPALVIQTLATGDVREIWLGKSGRGGGNAGMATNGRSILTWKVKDQTRICTRMDSITGEVKETWEGQVLPSGANQAGYSPDLMTQFFFRKEDTVACEGACTDVMFARDLKTSRDRELFRLKAASLQRVSVSISPDGGHMAMLARDGVAQMIVTASLKDGQLREIYRGTDEFSFQSATSTLDGRHVVAFRRIPKGEGFEVWSFPADGGSPEKSPLRMRPSEQPVVSPDGTQIAFVGGSRKSEVWVMTGLFPAAKPAAAH